MANIIQKVQKPTLVLAHNKTLAGQLYSEFKEFFPTSQVRLFYKLLWLLPTRGLHSIFRYLYRERFICKWWNRQIKTLSNSIFIWNERCNYYCFCFLYIWFRRPNRLWTSNSFFKTGYESTKKWCTKEINRYAIFKKWTRF